MTVVAVVDDNKVDRYTVMRRLSRQSEFSEVLEFDAGDTFLETYFARRRQGTETGKRLLVLMDINMPRLSGFETVAEMQQQMLRHDGTGSCDVMMFSSSENPMDQERAAEFDIVKGYIVKPFAVTDVDVLRRLC